MSTLEEVKQDLLDQGENPTDYTIVITDTIVSVHRTTEREKIANSLQRISDLETLVLQLGGVI